STHTAVVRTGGTALLCILCVAVAAWLGPRSVHVPEVQALFGTPALSMLAVPAPPPATRHIGHRVRGLQVRAVAELRARASVAPEDAQPLAYRLWVQGRREDVRSAGLDAILDAGIASFPDGFRRQFLAAIVPAVLPAARDWHVPPSVTLAQAILESGWGRSRLSARHHNLFGVKAGSSDKKVSMASREHKWGRLRASRETFRTYRDKGESIAHHARLLGEDRRYAHARPLWTDGPAFLAAIAPRYASSPRYVAKVSQIIDLYELDRWDALVAAAAAEDAGVDPGAWLQEANTRHLDALADSTFDDP
ncbi:MAG: glucosaminidase domain-containing protein, partial [Myxococcota bacterium]|nr:glucosaminidase domain-containing protein [Myxococcota bacterium]